MQMVIYKSERKEGLKVHYDEEADVLVVGSGAAAFSAAITAAEKGSNVIMLEKGSVIGGTTLRSGGGFWIPNNWWQKKTGIQDNKEDATRYMARYSYPQFYNPDEPMLGLMKNDFELIDTYYDRAHEAVEFLEYCGALKTINEINWTGKAQVDYMDHLTENKGIRGRIMYSQNKEGKLSYGGELIRQLKSWAEQNDLPILLNHEVKSILRNGQGEVVGLEVLKDGEETLHFHARKAVVFGSGGYTHNRDFMLHFQRGPHFGGCAAPTNTGDFIRMAGAIGAKLGNTAGAWRAEIILEEAIKYPTGVHNIFYVPGDSVLEVNKRGLRIMDEKRNYTDRAMNHFVWDSQYAEWTNMLVFMIFDQRTATLWQGFAPYPVQGTQADYLIKGDSYNELAENISARLKTLSSHTGGFALAPEFLPNLKKTIERFNKFAASGKDEDFGRGDFNYDREWTTFPPTVPGEKWPPEGSPNYTMYPLSEKGPYFAVILGAGTLDTNGGPVINKDARVLDTFDKPIPRLYGAGNCIASPTANAYWGGGSTIGPALTYGHIAGENAAKEEFQEI
ncbi:MAG TPA: FAD-dependent oxidoreductase [Atribacterota bacterium]|nr:FAD-dependent oxidoreductase [Atribacterota bacterium]